VGGGSRAVRTPSRVEQDLEADALIDPHAPLFVRLIRTTVESETVSLTSSATGSSAPDLDRRQHLLQRLRRPAECRARRPFTEPVDRLAHHRTGLSAIACRPTYGVEIAMEATPTRGGASRRPYVLEADLRPTPAVTTSRA
jgi:hypothetical protein